MVVTTVLKLRGRDEDSISNEGSADTGVCGTDLVVGRIVWSSDGSGPVMVGYTPVQ
jgi:hypothetical protein